jgi:RNA polymerase sigma factor (sigma-70 family)
MQMLPDATSKTPPDPAAEARALLERCVAGEAGAWDELVRRHRRLVYSVPRRAGLAADVCDDIFQETFTLLLRKLDRLHSPGGLPKWLATTARQLTLRRVRGDTFRAKTAAPVDSVDAAPAGVPSVEDALARWETRSQVAEAFAGLAARCRELLEAIVLGDGRPDYRAVADRLGMPIGSLGPTRARCLAALLRRLRDAGWTDPALERCISRVDEET